MDLPKGGYCLRSLTEGTEDMVNQPRPVFEQSWGLNAKTPGHNPLTANHFRLHHLRGEQ